jgi:hypothetical protein
MAKTAPADLEPDDTSQFASGALPTRASAALADSGGLCPRHLRGEPSITSRRPGPQKHL